MLVTLKRNADPGRVRAELARLGLWCKPLADASGRELSLWVESCSRSITPERLGAVDGVAGVQQAASGHPRVDALAGQVVMVRTPRGDIGIGADAPAVLMAGPCSVESEAQIGRAAAMASAAGARLLRGGAFKPRTSPYSFSGHGSPALSWMRQAADEHGLGMVTEVLSELDVDVVAEAADMLQVGSRNMQNFALLRAVGAAKMPVLLKRGMAATVADWLLAGEHLLAAGARGVVFCERGIVGFDPTTRNLLDLGSVALLSHVHRLPVVVDPSHAAGRRDLIVALAEASLGAGAHGLLIEAHPHAETALSDGPQALDAEALASVGRRMSS